MSHWTINLLKVGGILMWRICHIKGIVHPKMKSLWLSAYPQGIQDLDDFVSSVEHKDF